MAERRQLHSDTIMRGMHARKLVAETQDLRVGIMNDLVHLRAEGGVFVGETSREEVLVNAFRCGQFTYGSLRSQLRLTSPASFDSCKTPSHGQHIPLSRWG